MLSQWANWLRSRTGKRVSHPRAHRAQPRARLYLEELERRLAPAVATLGGLEFVADSFTATPTSNGTLISATTQVQVGKESASFLPLLTVAGGVQFINNDPSGAFATSGAVKEVVDS